MTPVWTRARFWIYSLAGIGGLALCIGSRQTYYAAAFWLGFALGGICYSLAGSAGRWCALASIASMLASVALAFGPSNLDAAGRGWFLILPVVYIALSAVRFYKLAKAPA